jgi:copper(I)-binding protein
MVFNPDRPLKAGDNVIIHFNFSDGSSSIIETPVKKRISDAHNHHHH